MHFKKAMNFSVIFDLQIFSITEAQSLKET